MVVTQNDSGKADLYHLLEHLRVGCSIILRRAQLRHPIKLTLLVLNLKRPRHYLHRLHTIPLIKTLLHCRIVSTLILQLLELLYCLLGVNHAILEIVAVQVKRAEFHKGDWVFG